MNPTYLSNHQIQELCKTLVTRVRNLPKGGAAGPLKIYGWPRGGIPVAYILCAQLNAERTLSMVVDMPEDADVIVDDIIDSGRTQELIAKSNPDKPFFALIDKRAHPGFGWVVFPWENALEGDSSGEDVVVRLLQYLGEDPARGGLIETPKRVMKAWREMTCGYGCDPKELLKTFDDGAEGVDEMVTVQDIPVWSFCEHHMLPFFGKATVSYIPNKKIVGLSKLARVVDAFSRRLQVQERLTNQIADLLNDTLNPVGVGVHLKCRHLCMEARGVKVPCSNTVTTALRGAIRKEDSCRAEFLNLTNKG